jgi:hypothetical protein
MAFDFQQSYSPAIAQPLRQYYQSLSEQDRRRFAALEALTLGQGGLRDIAQVLGGDPQTVPEGMPELQPLPHDPARQRVRKPGGGRKKTEGKHTALIQHVQETIKDRTAGDPMRADVGWTDLPPPKRVPTACRPTMRGCRPTHRGAHARYARVCPAPDGQGLAWG